MNRTAILFAASLSTASLGFAQEAQAPSDSGRFSVGIGLRLGSLSGQILDHEAANSDALGLRLYRPGGDTFTLDPLASTFGIDACALYRIASRVQVGVAFVTQTTGIRSSHTSDERFSGDLLEEQAILARARVRLWEHDGFRLVVEGGVGRGSGKLHRFSLGMNNLDSIQAGILRDTGSIGANRARAANVAAWITLANRGLDVSGSRYEASLLLVKPLTSHLSIDARLGFHRTSLSATGTDSLKAFAKEYGFEAYPSPVSALGIDLVLGLSAVF